MIAVIPKTNAIFAIFEPITFPKAKSGEPVNAAFKLTNNSGAEVAKDTTVIPIISFDKFNLKDSPTEERTKNSPPMTNNIKPIIINAILINYFFSEDSLSCFTVNKKTKRQKTLLF